MVYKSRNNMKKLLSLVVVLVAVLVLAFPAGASEYIPPSANLAQTPTVEINPDANHHDHSSADFLRVPLSLAELAVSSCSGGFAAEYPCQGIDFMSRVPLTSFNGNPASASNLWGYVDLDDNREYAIIGLRNGTGVVEVTDPANPRVVETIVGVTSQWREVKVYQFWNATASRWDAYAYVTTEGAGGGIQIIDLTQLPASVSLAATWTGVSTSHTDQISNIDFTTNVSNNPNFSPVLYISGANTGGLRFVSLANPTSLTEIGFWTGTYSHDTYPHVFTDARANQCASGHNPCEVVFSFAGTAGLKIIDVTNKSAPVTLSTLTYSQLGYVHSGWISSDGNYLFLHDELDEQNFGGNSRIRTINITSLTAPTVSTIYSGPTLAIDHNGYTIGNKFYFSNYTRGIGVLDITNPNAPVELGYFDTYPTSNSATFNGAWGVYPFLPSGNILISDIQRGLIVVREQSGGPTPTPAVTNTPTNTPIAAGTPTQTNTLIPTTTATQTLTPSNTGFLSPGTNAAQTSSAGDNNGFELAASNAHADGGGVAQDVNSGTKNDSSCTSNSKDKHRFYDFNISLPGGATVKGIEVRLDAFADSTSSSPKICVQLSWDGGTTWTTVKQTPTLMISQTTYILGGPTDTWGRTWTLANLSNANFRVRVIDLASTSGATSRDFSLDWIAVRVSY
jgi:choice-of-anchor B domain-containing protein